MDWSKLQRFEKVFNSTTTRILTKKGIKWAKIGAMFVLCELLYDYYVFYFVLPSTATTMMNIGEKSWIHE